MKKLVLLVFLCTFLLSWAQTPEKINFQIVLHETEGGILANQNVKMIINIISESENGDIVYREEHTVQSNQFGMINLQVGTGDVLYGNWQDILWGSSNQFLMIELDTSGTGNNYLDMGIAQMLSVPYALFANETETSSIWQENESGIHYLIGNVAIGQNLPSDDLELATDLKIELSSDESDLSSNALLKVMMDADTAEPTINWRDENNIYKSSISIEDFTTNPLTASKRVKFYTADNTGIRRSHLEVNYDENFADVLIHDAKLIVENNFTSGSLSSGSQNLFWSHNWVNNGQKFGIGDKDWETDGVFGNAAAEMYTNGEDNYLLLNAAEELDRCQLILRRGNAEWAIGQEDLFYFKRNDSKKMKFMPDGKIKIGSNDPLYKLDVYGDVNIPVGYSYLIGGGKSSGKYAEYFESEEDVEIGSAVGLNLNTGLVRAYQAGDVFVGIACQPTGFIANAKYSQNENYICVGLEGLIEIDNYKNHISNQQVFTSDGNLIGTLIGDKVFLQ